MIVKIAFQVRVAPPQNFVAPHPEGEESKDQVVYDHHSQLQKTAFSLVKIRLALGSPGWLVVTMPKMAQYTGKWLLTSL